MNTLKSPLTNTCHSFWSPTPGLFSGSAKKSTIHVIAFMFKVADRGTFRLMHILQPRSDNVNLRPGLHPCLLWFRTKMSKDKPRGVPHRSCGLCKQGSRRTGQATNTPVLQSTDRRTHRAPKSLHHHMCSHAPEDHLLLWFRTEFQNFNLTIPENPLGVQWKRPVIKKSNNKTSSICIIKALGRGWLLSVRESIWLPDDSTILINCLKFTANDLRTITATISWNTSLSMASSLS